MLWGWERRTQENPTTKEITRIHPWRIISGTTRHTGRGISSSERAVFLGQLWGCWLILLFASLCLNWGMNTFGVKPKRVKSWGPSSSRSGEHRGKGADPSWARGEHEVVESSELASGWMLVEDSVWGRSEVRMKPKPGGDLSLIRQVITAWESISNLGQSFYALEWPEKKHWKKEGSRADGGSLQCRGGTEVVPGGGEPWPHGRNLLRTL